MTILIFQFVVLIFSVMIHEVSHGAIAYRLGDPTAKLAGRLNLNPLKHIDPFGSIILPLLLALPALFGQPTFIIGWAKPVPYNPYNLKNPERGAAIIAAAGPLSNVLIAFIFGLLMRVIAPFSVANESLDSLLLLFSLIVSLNLLLAMFNLLPVPPIDGAKIVSYFLPPAVRLRFMGLGQSVGFWIRRNFFVFILLLFFILPYIFDAIFFVISPFVRFFHLLFTGFPSPFF